jgi:hypothetical protein
VHVSRTNFYQLLAANIELSLKVPTPFNSIEEAKQDFKVLR